MIGRPQFRLRSLFILTAVVAVACATGLALVEAVGVIHTASLAIGLTGLVGVYAGDRQARKRPTATWPVVLMLIGFVLATIGLIGTFVGGVVMPHHTRTWHHPPIGQRRSR
jgi:hypothetical protein